MTYDRWDDKQHTHYSTGCVMTGHISPGYFLPHSPRLERIWIDPQWSCVQHDTVEKGEIRYQYSHNDHRLVNVPGYSYVHVVYTSIELTMLTIACNTHSEHECRLCHIQTYMEWLTTCSTLHPCLRINGSLKSGGSRKWMRPYRHVALHEISFIRRQAITLWK